MKKNIQKSRKIEDRLNERSVASRDLKKAEHGQSLQIAFHEIRELIVHGRLAPGTWIVEGDIAEKLNMSRTPVRAAIQWLQREGYVLEQRGTSKSRMIVAPLTKEDANELYLIIGRLEGIAARGTTQRTATERQKLADKLDHLNSQLGTIASGKGRPGDIFDIDRQFHRLIVDAGAGSRLTALHRAIEPQAERYWRLYASSIINSLGTSVAEHAEIIKALRRGDASGIEAGLQINWSEGAERLGRVIDVFGERGSW